MIYFIQQDIKGPIKIGYTENNVEKRKVSLQTGNPYKLYILATKKGNLNDESFLHDKFYQYRMSGEWFQRNDELLKYIKINAHFHNDYIDLLETKIANQKHELSKLKNNQKNKKIKKALSLNFFLEKYPQQDFIDEKDRFYIDCNLTNMSNRSNAKNFISKYIDYRKQIRGNIGGCDDWCAFAYALNINKELYYLISGDKKTLEKNNLSYKDSKRLNEMFIKYFEINQKLYQCKHWSTLDQRRLNNA